ncbi:NAD(P)-dependent alcohol dehydrogenase [Demequina sp. SYSU T00192]|uniref:NAD(P)-dependent alcohol dehydrogenase n=1 Tax=Demequina litoralis TaxID=3051660 RepID=A0ABT8GDK5_9MICO|nr:NAD(P)-dependent alcohol dehydrogenase [Demequina sp. SYSU T00192]MDN4476749.1 NAD(P)-dependent alcohol dehydrogenase [Demequina sp. SYSU T00192]
MTAAVPATMRAVAQEAYGGVERLALADVPVPRPGAADVLVRVEAAALNPADVFLMRGEPRVLRLAYGLRRPRRPVRGSDVAGTVVAVGERVTDLRVGDRIFGEARGSLAEYAVAPAAKVAVLPEAVPAATAAAAVMTGLAAMHGLRAARLEPGQTLLVNGASGGIGHLAVQLAAAQGATVTAVCSTRNVGWVGELGAARVVDYTREPVLDLDQRFDVVFDNVGNHALRDMLALVREGGVMLPNSGEPGPDGGGLRRVLRARWLDLVTRRRVVTYLSTADRADLEELGAMLAAGSLRPHIDSVHPLDRAAEAMGRVASRHAAGKVVVEP